MSSTITENSINLKKYKKILLDHEQSMLEQGRLKDHTHPQARSVILLADSLQNDGSKLFDLLIASTLLTSSQKKTTATSIPQNDVRAASYFRKKYNGVTFNANKLFKLRPDLFQHVVEEQQQKKRKQEQIPKNSNDDDESKPAIMISPINNFFTVVYRPVGDDELKHLLTLNQLPSTQPYQAIMEGQAGRAYAERYVDGTKRVDTTPATVIEIVAPTALIQKLFEKQQKPEDGCLSHGLGFAAGKDLDVMNLWLKEFSECFCNCDDDDDQIAEEADEANDVVVSPEEDCFASQRAWRIVKVKRKIA